MPFFRERVNLLDCGPLLDLSRYAPVFALDGLTTGVDNLRHDVFLSPKFTQLARVHIARLVAQHGAVDDLSFAEPTPVAQPGARRPDRSKGRAAETADFKAALAELHTSALNRAKAEGRIAIDMLCRLAIVKFLRAETAAQFAVVLERLRALAKASEGARHGSDTREIELRERAAQFQMAKKTVLRRVGQELFALLRNLEKEELARLRRSLFGDTVESAYELFLNRLIFTEDGRDDFLNAEHYLMLGNFDRDPDRFTPLRDVIIEFLRAVGVEATADEFDSLLNSPENAHQLLASAALPPEFRDALSRAWVEALERAGVMAHIIAAYEAAPLLAEYSPPLNPQQLKNALIFRAERKRVAALLDEHTKLSSDNFEAAVRRTEHCRGAERARIAARFLGDFLRYHRDVRRLEAFNTVLEQVNLIAAERLRELSAINGTLYEFLLAEEQKPADSKVVHHIILKADVRDSTRLIRSLYERSLNPASYFSLNFYEPINKLLPKYGAQKLFIEGDAIILALFERAGETGFGVGRACVLAKEIIEIVRGYNGQSHKSGLPALELGIGIAFQDTAPMYLMDGPTQIMISPALNESDRLSSCSKSARRFCAGVETLFNVFAFQTIDDADTAGQPDEFLIRYNIGGIVLNEPAFQKLQQEIVLTARDVRLPTLWDEGAVRLYTGVVPVSAGIFHNVVVREARVPHIDAREFQLKTWTGRRYYEICTNPAVYEFMALDFAAPPPPRTASAD